MLAGAARNPDAPWLTGAAASILTDWLRHNDTVFEWGSGKSTSWFAQHAARVISVEHDPKWYDAVGDRLAQDSHSLVERYLVETTDTVTNSLSDDTWE